ncbi:uncharacterized protein AB9W97_003852 isoform 1-T4 [Spinachia spinachia]
MKVTTGPFYFLQDSAGRTSCTGDAFTGCCVCGTNASVSAPHGGRNTLLGGPGVFERDEGSRQFQDERRGQADGGPGADGGPSALHHVCSQLPERSPNTKGRIIRTPPATVTPYTVLHRAFGNHGVRRSRRPTGREKSFQFPRQRCPHPASRSVREKFPCPDGGPTGRTCNNPLQSSRISGPSEAGLGPGTRRLSSQSPPAGVKSDR